MSQLSEPINTQNLDWDGYREYVYSKYRGNYRTMCFNYARKYLNAINNPSILETLSKYKKNNVLKALIALAKYHGFYKQFKDRIKDYGIKWSRASSIDSFMRIFNNSNEDVLEWYQKASNILNQDYSTYLKFLLKSGMRALEALESFNLIIILQKQGKLAEYYNEESGTLEHFRYKDKFLRTTKNVFITMVSKDFVTEISEREPINIYTIRAKIQNSNLSSRMNELRDYFGTFMVRHGLIKEEVDLLQGRVGESIFIRHYFSPAIQELKERVSKALNELEHTILS